MHVVIRKYATSPDVIEETRRNLEDLEETMRGIPGFVAYYVIEMVMRHIGKTWRLHEVGELSRSR